jgi:pimeloyl-ACP methyl ester carboxylesterase
MFPPKIEPPFDKLPAHAQKARLWALSHPKLSAAGEDYWPEELQQMHATRRANQHPLGDIPLVVLAAGKQEGGGPPPGLSADEWKRLTEEKRRQKADQASLSSNSKFVVDPKSAHHIHLDDPALVIDSIREVVEAVRHHGRFDPSRNTTRGASRDQK